MVERGYCIYSISLNILTYFLHLNNYLVTLFHNTICRAQLFCPFLLSASEYLSNMLFSYHLLYFCTALSLIIMLSSHYHHHKSKTFSQLTQCPFTGTLLLFFFWGGGGGGGGGGIWQQLLPWQHLKFWGLNVCSKIFTVFCNLKYCS